MFKFQDLSKICDMELSGPLWILSTLKIPGFRGTLGYSNIHIYLMLGLY